MAIQYKKRFSKYRNKKTEVDGIVFDSQKEASRYLDLKMLEVLGEIKNLELCKECNRLDENSCKICTLDKLVDTIICDTCENETCPVCYKDLTIRYVTICDDNRHKLCTTCYKKINESLDLLCPICRQYSEEV